MIILFVSNMVNSLFSDANLSGFDSGLLQCHVNTLCRHMLYMYITSEASVMSNIAWPIGQPSFNRGKVIFGLLCIYQFLQWETKWKFHNASMLPYGSNFSRWIFFSQILSLFLKLLQLFTSLFCIFSIVSLVLLANHMSHNRENKVFDLPVSVQVRYLKSTSKHGRF